MEREEFRRELDGLRDEVQRKPGKGWVIGTSIVITLLVLVVIVAIMMFAMMSRMQSAGMMGFWSETQIEQPLRQEPATPPAQQPVTPPAQQPATPPAQQFPQ